MKNHELEAELSHVCIPKLDADAFLIGSIADWEDLNLLDGDAYIYFADTYVGVSEIDTRSVSDTLDLSLGRDKQVLVTRMKKKDFNSKKFIGLHRKESFKYEIVVKNNSSEDVQLELIDQVPISQENDIEVNTEEMSNANLNEENGKLSWDMKLASGKSRKVVISFTVKYPRNKRVRIRKSRNVSAPAKFW